MKVPNLLSVVLHGSVQSERYKNIVMTWGRNKPILFYSDHEDKKNKIIKVSNRKDYHSNEDKFVNVFQNMPKDSLEYDWYLFCDNDTFVNHSYLSSCLSSFDPQKIYGQQIFCWQKDISLGYLSGGAGILMSHKSLLHAIDNFKSANVGYSDVSFGLYLRDNRIEIINDKRFHSQPPKYYFIKDGDTHKYFTFHYIVDNNYMQKLHTIAIGRKY